MDNQTQEMYISEIENTIEALTASLSSDPNAYYNPIIQNIIDDAQSLVDNMTLESLHSSSGTNNL